MACFTGNFSHAQPCEFLMVFPKIRCKVTLRNECNEIPVARFTVRGDLLLRVAAHAQFHGRHVVLSCKDSRIHTTMAGLAFKTLLGNMKFVRENKLAFRARYGNNIIVRQMTKCAVAGNLLFMARFAVFVVWYQRVR